MRSHISIAIDWPDLLAIRDLNDGATSVTNDAEGVVAWLHRNKALDDRRLIYEDTDGVWDELVHSGGTFLGFGIIGALTLEQAVGRIKPQSYSVTICSAITDAVPFAEVYSGPSYQDAFDSATNARGNVSWRGKWIKFQTPEAVKWAQIN